MSDFTVVAKDSTYSPGWYDEGYLDEEGNVEPYSSGRLAGIGKITTFIEGDLADRVLARVGSTNGIVSIIEDHWDIGYCVTCSDEMVDFEVLVDGEKVFRTDYYGSGEYSGTDYELTQFVNGYAQFQTWLDGGEED